MTTIKNIYLYARNINPEDVRYVKETLDQLERYKLQIFYHRDFISAIQSYKILIIKDYKEQIREFEEIVEENNSIIIALGGDGTMLHVIYLLRGRQIPVLGINLGRLGFLAGVKKKEIETAFGELMSGKYYIDHRSMIGVQAANDLFSDFPYALNEFSVRRLDSSAMINVSVYIDNELLNNYWADGLLVSTPTGSTAYSLSCGGPILFPQSGNFVITTVAPHNLSVRPVVFDDNKKIRIQAGGRAKSFMVTLDSRNSYIPKGRELILEKAPFKALLVYVGSSTFMRRLREKLLWGEDIRN